MKIVHSRFLFTTFLLIIFLNCSKEDNSNSQISTSSNSSVSYQNNSSTTSSNSSGSDQDNSSSTVVNSDFECDNWFYNLPKHACI